MNKKFFLFTFVILACKMLYASEYVMLNDLMRNSSNYDNKNISVEGYLCIEHPTAMLIQDPLTCHVYNAASIEIEVTRDMLQKRENYGADSYVRITGLYGAVPNDSIVIDSGSRYGVIKNPKVDILGVPKAR